jgi:hypothetical protein
MKEIKIIDTINVVGAGFKVSNSFEIPWSDIIFAGASFGLGRYFWPVIIPVVIYKYGYTITDFTPQEPIKEGETNTLPLT